MGVRRVEVVGIGCGAAGLLTEDAKSAISSLDVVLEFDKGDQRADLSALRTRLLDAHAKPNLRRVVLTDRRREGDSYTVAVERWHETRAQQLHDALKDVDPTACVGILVWGDPALFDSTLRLLDRVKAIGGLELSIAVVPGISSPQLLAARFAVSLHRVGGSVLITTGRRIREAGFPSGIDDAVVMLDSGSAFTTLVGGGFDLYWAAYLGMPEETLRSGNLDDIAQDVVATREALRSANGWIFDLYLVRRRF